MQVRLFTKSLKPDTNDADAFELEINNWLNETDIDVLSMTVSASERDGITHMVFFVVFDEPEDDDERDELPVTLPNITVQLPFDKLTPRLRQGR